MILKGGKMKKTIFTFICVFLAFATTGCDFFAPAEKEFSGSGITITLNDDFAVTETVLAPLYLVSLDHVFMGMRESKSLANAYDIYSLQDYATAVLTNGGKTDVSTYNSNETGATYIYAYYTSTVDGNDYGYMLVCMESSTYFYSMNFGCLEENLEDSKTIYHNWADTIIVE